MKWEPVYEQYYYFFYGTGWGRVGWAGWQARDVIRWLDARAPNHGINEVPRPPARVRSHMTRRPLSCSCRLPVLRAVRAAARSPTRCRHVTPLQPLPQIKQHSLVYVLLIILCLYQPPPPVHRHRITHTNTRTRARPFEHLLEFARMTF